MPERVFVRQPSGDLPRIAHIADGAEEPARCGANPWPSRWLGTKGDADRQAAYGLTLCMGCVHAVKQARRR